MSFAEIGAAAIAAGIDDMYASFLKGDREGFDAHLHDDVTTWETHLPGPLRTRSELDSYRDTRDSSGARPVLDVMVAAEKRIDVWGDTGVARYVLVTRDAASGAEQRSRVTDVLRCIDGAWRIVHHHSELVRP